MATKTQKQVQIIHRYEFKDRNLVVYEVRSSNGIDTYRTTFLDGKVTGCSCPARKPCYHMTQLQQREDSRLVARVDTMIQQAQAKLAEKSELHTCDTCWRQVKPEITTCACCLGY